MRCCFYNGYTLWTTLSAGLLGDVLCCYLTILVVTARQRIFQRTLFTDQVSPKTHNIYSATIRCRHHCVYQQKVQERLSMRAVDLMDAGYLHDLHKVDLKMAIDWINDMWYRPQHLSLCTVRQKRLFRQNLMVQFLGQVDNMVF